MNLVLLHDADFVGDEAVLHGRRARHVREIHAVVAGDSLVAGRVNGAIGEAKVLATSEDEVRLAFRPTRPPPPSIGIDLMLAIPRPKVLRRVLASAASMGVKRIVLVNAARVEKSYFDSPIAADDSMHESLCLGLEQARDTVMPEVLVQKRFRPFVEDVATTLWNDAVKLLAHPADGSPIERCGLEAARKCVLAIGPEGGWVPFELDLMRQQGFVPVTLGERILRTDVAVTYGLAQLDLARRLASPHRTGPTGEAGSG